MGRYPGGKAPEELWTGSWSAFLEQLLGQNLIKIWSKLVKICRFALKFRNLSLISASLGIAGNSRTLIFLPPDFSGLVQRVLGLVLFWGFFGVLVPKETKSCFSQNSFLQSFAGLEVKFQGKGNCVGSKRKFCFVSLKTPRNSGKNPF